MKYFPIADKYCNHCFEWLTTLWIISVSTERDGAGIAQSVHLLGYGMYNWRIVVRLTVSRSREFNVLSLQTGCAAQAATSSTGTGSSPFPNIKRPEREVVHSSSTSAEVKNAGSYTATPLLRLYDLNRQNFRFNGKVFSRGQSGRSVEFTTHLHLMPGLRMSGAIPPLPHMPSKPERRQLCLLTRTFLNPKRPQRETKHSPLFNTEIKNEWSYTSTAPCVFVAWTGTALLLCCDGQFQLVCRKETLTSPTRISGPGSIFVDRTSSDHEVAMQLLWYSGRRWRKRCA